MSAHNRKPPACGRLPKNLVAFAPAGAERKNFSRFSARGIYTSALLCYYIVYNKHS